MRNLRFTLCLLLTLLVSVSAFSQNTLLHYWHFNNFVGVGAATNPDNLVPYRADFSVMDTSTVKVIYRKLPGTSNNYTTFWDAATTGDTVNARQSQPAGSYLRLRNPSDSMALLFYIPSTGYQDITIKYAVQRSSAANGATVNTFDYSIDSGLTWITTGLSRDTINTSAAWRIPAAEIKIINSAANNNPRLVFRIRFTGAQNIGTSGNNRIDNFTVEGNPFTPPQKVLLHYWHFNSFNSGLTAATALSNIIPYRADSSRLDTSKVKVAFQALAGTPGNFRTYWDNVSPGDTTNLRAGITGLGLGLRPRNPTDSMQLVWYIPTTGYSSPEIKFASQKSSAANGAAVLRFSYSIDSGANWITTGLSQDTFATSVNWVSTPVITINNTAVNDNPRFVFRIVFGGPGNTGTSGNSRIDNFSVDAFTTTSGGDGSVSDITPPTAAFNPANNANGVLRSINPTITFSEPVRLMNGALLDSNNVDTIVEVRLNDSTGTLVPFNANISGNGRVITISPNNLLNFNTTYFVAVKQGMVKDTANNALVGRPFTRFTTEQIQTQLTASDMLPVAYRTNATGSPDEIALLTFVDILPGTQIRLTDAKFTSNTPAQCPGGLVWTAPAQGVPAGATLIISTDNGTANVGSVTGATFGLSSNGDQVIVYQGANTNPTYITALSSISWLSSNTSCTGSLSMIPAGLTNLVNAIALNQVNAYYNGPQTGTIAQLKAAITDTTNWIGAAGGTAPQQWPAYVFFGPPAVRNATVVNATTIRLVYSSNMDSASVVKTSNYSGIANLQSVTYSSNGILADTVWLNYSTPFAASQSYTLTIDSVKDASQRMIFTPFTFNFQYNTVISWNNAFVSVKEDTGTVSIRLNLSNPNTSSVRVALKPAPWTNADSTTDFTFATQTLNFTGASNSIQIINIPINNDVLREQDEYFVLELQNPVGATISGNALLTVFIRDNDNTAPVATKSIELIHKYSFDPNPNGSTTEVIAYDSASKRLFTTSTIQNRFDIIDFSNPDSAVRISSVDMTPYGGMTSIAVYNGLVAAASPNANEQLNGSVVFFNTNGQFIKQLIVGALPDMITFTHDGKKVITCDEGQPNAAYTVDPEGSVSIIDISAGINNTTQANVKTKYFTHFNANEAALIAAGVRKTRIGGTLSQDIEPEYVTISDDNTRAWVTLQENNSIAELDLITDSIVSIWPMGTKDLNAAGNGFDASDNSGVVHLCNWPVKAFYMPDAIASYKVGNVTYLVTANEGDEREYAGLNERTTVGNANTILDPAVFPHAAWLKLPYNLGRFRITNLNGNTDQDNEYEELYTVGSRSFSIFNASTRQMVYESKGDFELITSQHPKSASIFNANHEDNAIKGRSHSKGPEPEAVAIGNIWGKNYAFIGLERVGGVMVYDVTDPANTVFVDYNNTRSLTSYSGDHGPEITLFIPASKSPNGKPYLLVSNEISGTVTVFEVKNNQIPSAVSFNSATQAVNENAGTVNVRVNITPNAAVSGQIKIRRVHGTGATSADYTTSPAFVNDTLTLNVNANDTVATFSINVVDDNVDESNETITFQLVSVSEALTIGTPATFTFTITDNDTTIPARSISFERTAIDTVEGTISFPVFVRSNFAASGNIGVRIRITNGTGVTYGSSGTYTSLPAITNDTVFMLIPNGMDRGAVTLFVNDNILDEPNKQITFTIEQVYGNAVLGTANLTSVVTLIDNDTTIPARAVSFAQATQSVNEDIGTVTATVSLSAPSDGNSQISIYINRGTGITNSDFIITPATIVTADSITLNIPNGQTSATFSIDINDDTETESNETLTFAIVQVQGNVTIGTPASFALTIADNDGTGVKDAMNVNSKIRMYPNPNQSGVLHFSENVSVQLIDMSGKLLIEGTDCNTMNISHIAAGVYTVKLNNGEIRKLIVK
jgi:hypothetical protein